ncbi:hypothetical protein MGYG_05562 [Nannizzia gypsea CBS 118893]|uniref:Uncharacterized protein n=1 Tax=Arthroderma gypseum (strain ATCC MYA-4604 / CBS 118893) TaxID=535722 RepID=E4UWM3_ARTGP|nr:hypothetical protein MGYG_05562 [Nannizzia gypsea CBS 118893]EFR02566.1 hypothetical protein MGYG_05562 [Nannizzia gypsea CBS 118893]
MDTSKLQTGCPLLEGHRSSCFIRVYRALASWFLAYLLKTGSILMGELHLKRHYRCQAAEMVQIDWITAASRGCGENLAGYPDVKPTNNQDANMNSCEKHPANRFDLRDEVKDS